MNVDGYIAGFPDSVQQILTRIRAIILGNGQGVREEIAYGMPAYKLNGKPLVYFAGYKSHIGFYATPTGHLEFKKELSKYKQGKGSVQFQLNEPIPFDLIETIVVFRIKETLTK